MSTAGTFGEVSGAADCGIVAAAAKPTISARRAGVVNFMMLLVEGFAQNRQAGLASKLSVERYLIVQMQWTVADEIQTSGREQPLYKPSEYLLGNFGSDNQTTWLCCWRLGGNEITSLGPSLVKRRQRLKHWLPREVDDQ